MWIVEFVLLKWTYLNTVASFLFFVAAILFLQIKRGIYHKAFQKCQENKMKLPPSLNIYPGGTIMRLIVENLSLYRLCNVHNIFTA